MFNGESEVAKNDDSAENLSQEVDDVLDEPIASVEPSTAEKVDMENLEVKGGNLEQSRLDLIILFRRTPSTCAHP